MEKSKLGNASLECMKGYPSIFEYYDAESMSASIPVEKFDKTIQEEVKEILWDSSLQEYDHGWFLGTQVDTVSGEKFISLEAKGIWN